MTTERDRAKPEDLTPERMTIEELEAAIDYHDRRYFVDAAPEISDYDYDRLRRRLEALRPDSPVLQRVGAGVAEAATIGQEVVHERPMLSLDKCYEGTELARWAAGFEGPVVVTPKVDGVAASLRYDASGRLALAATRGDGVRGEDFTANAYLVPEIPTRLRYAGGAPIEVRGEVHMRISTFDERYRALAANPRNLTAGTLKRKQSDRGQLRDLSFFAYDLIGPTLATEWDKMLLLEAYGFRVVEARRVEKADMEEAYGDWLARRKSLDFEVDGVVFKADRLTEQARLGATAHHPRYAIAYKFQGDSGESVLKAVQWNVSRTGAVNPMAVVDPPIELSGAMVSRASLHNLNILRRHALHIGDRVVLMRRGGVIPNLEHSLGGGSEPVEIPSECPSCKGPTRAEQDVLLCERPETCRDAQVSLLEHYVGVLGVDGYGRKLLEQLYERGLARDPADLYRLGAHHLVMLERVGDILAKKLVANRDAARRVPLATFLQALGIDELGKNVAGLLATALGTLERVRAVTVEELLTMRDNKELRGVSDKIATAVVTGLARRADLIDRLLEHVEVLPEAPPTVAAAGPLAGESIVFTGELRAKKRSDAQAEARTLGATTPDSVTKDVTLLVDAGEKAGKKSSKRLKAEKLAAEGRPIRIVDEEAYWKLVEEKTSRTD